MVGKKQQGKAASGMSLCLFILGAFLVLMPGTSGAQEEEEYVLEDTIVTSTKTGETLLQKTPIAISVFDEEAINKVTAFEIQDLAAFMPSVEISRSSASSNAIFIRGIGSQIATLANEHSIGFYIDGAYLYQGRGSYVDFMDIERVEVIRGPQGTTYGRNSTGGLINIITKKPSNELELEAGVEIGNYALRKVNAAISGPLVKDKLLARFSVLDSEHDPYFDNTHGPGLGDQNTHMFRASLQALPTDNIDIILRGDWRETDRAHTEGNKILNYDGPRGQEAAALGITEEEFIPSDFHTVAWDRETFDREEIWGMVLEVNIDFAHEIHLKSLTSYREWYASQYFERDNSPLPWGPNDLSDGERLDSWQQDLVLNGSIGSFHWLVGGAYISVTQDRPNDAIWLSAVNGLSVPQLIETESWSLFAELKYDITDDLTVSGGVRRTVEDKYMDFNLEVFVGTPEMHYPGGYEQVMVVARPPFPEAENKVTNWSPKIGLNYQATDDIFLYGYVAEGFKSGTVYPMNWPFFNPEVDPETVLTYEAGIKSDWFDKRLRFNAAVFLNEYEDYQVRTYPPGSVAVLAMVNAGGADINGFEIEAVARPTQSLTVSGGVTYLDTEYVDFVLPEGNAAGNPVSFTPEWAATLGASYVVPVKDYGFLTFDANVGWRDDAPQGHFGNTDPVFWTEDRALVNARVRYETEDGRWTLELYGKNILDEEYYNFKERLDGNNLLGNIGDPMTVGLRAAFKY